MIASSFRLNKSLRSGIIFYIIFALNIFGNLDSLKAQVKITDGAVLTINTNSLLELVSVNKGLMIPQMAINNLNQALPLTAPVPAGMMVYSIGGTVIDGFYYWDGTQWKRFVQAVVQVNEGGTGLNSIGNSDDVLAVNSSATGYTHRAIKQQIGTWGVSNLAKSSINRQLLIVASGGTSQSVSGSRIQMAFDGYIIGVTLSGSAPCTAGLATFTVFKNAVATTIITDINSTTNTQYSYLNTGTVSFIAGDILDIRVTTNAAFRPENSEYSAWIIIEWTN